jgi:hypothetical protein
MFVHAIFLFVFGFGLHSFKLVDNKWFSSHYVCIMWKKWLKKLMGQWKKGNIFPM